MKEANCVICRKKIEGMGNNAMPFKRGVCCDKCNLTKVIPKRIEQTKITIIKP